jgi:hypothetical protein
MLNPDDPYSESFEISTLSLIPMDIGVTIQPCAISSDGLNMKPDQDPTPYGKRNICHSQGIRIMNLRWQNRPISFGHPYEISLNDPVEFPISKDLPPSGFILPPFSVESAHQLHGADLLIVVTYSLFGYLKLEDAFRFVGEKQTNGKIVWKPS